MTQSDSNSDRWYVAIDGGGSKIAGAIAKQTQGFAYNPQKLAVIRHVAKGTGSAATTTWNVARSNLIRMLDRLLKEASIEPEKISNVVLMLAGAGRPDDVARVKESLTNGSPFGSCMRLTVTSDMQPLLFEARDSLRGTASIVVIVGTGSLVAALAPNENVVRAGGWGPILGDEGSGWRLAQAFLQLFCWWIDRGHDAESTPEGLQVLNSFLAEKQMPIVPEKLNSSLIALAADRHLAAQLAPAILELATQPNSAATLQLVKHQTALLVDQIQQVHRRLAIADHEWRLCLAGGLASNDKRFHHFLSTELTRRAIEPASVVVIDPLGAALRFASQLC